MATASATPVGAPTSVAAGGSSRHHQAPYRPQYHTQALQQQHQLQQKRPPQTAPATSAVPAKKTFNFTLKDIDRYTSVSFFEESSSRFCLLSYWILRF